MGNILYCDKCTPVAYNSVFTFSKDLVLKYTEGKAPKALTKAQLDYLENIDDERLFEKLQCIDNKHSELCGITNAQIEFLIKRLEVLVDNITLPGCRTEAYDIQTCYEKHKECSIQCEDEVNKYMECIDNAIYEKLHPIPASKACINN